MPQARPPYTPANSAKNFAKPADLQHAISLLNVVHTPQGKGVDMMWRLFNSMSKREPRFPNMYAAAVRMAARRQTSPLPPREAFTTTVDYYEAIVPLVRARGWFRLFALVEYNRGARKVCDTIIPRKLF